MFPVSFSKMSGTGNDFIIIDHRQPFIPLDQQPEFARRVCRRMFSVGADGLILIENAVEADFGWRFYNADGSEAAMCGNGSRCAARYAFRHGIAGRRMRLQTLAGIIAAEVLESEEELVRVQLTPPHGLRQNLSVQLDGAFYPVSFLDTGVPHAVVFCDEKELPVCRWGREVRLHPHFAPAGTNANFVRILAHDEIAVRTYERGVENETMACGTGAVASAILAAIEQGVSSPVRVVTSGGERLTVAFSLTSDQQAQAVTLLGPARLVYTGTLTAEALL